MENKYEGLPGVDIGIQDTFETSDLDTEPEDEVRVEPNEDIDVSAVDSDQIRKLFENNSIKRVPDFLGSIVKPLGDSGYAVDEVKETIDQKLARIARELQEISLERDNGDTTTKQNEEITRLKALEENLNKNEGGFNEYSVKLTELFKRKNSTPNQLEPGILPSLQPISQSLQLESRITELENLIGETNQTSIQNIVHDLSRKINIIHNPEYQMMQITEKIKELDTEYEKLLTKRKLFDIEPSQIDVSQDDKINLLYSHLSDFEQVNNAVPLIIRRLKSLNVVHSDLSNSVDVVNNLDDILQEMKLDFNRWNESLEVVNTSLDNNQSLFDSNKQTILDQLDQLTSKVDKLSDE